MTISRKLHIETVAATGLREFLKTLTDDEETRRDTIEAETNLHETIHAALQHIVEQEILLTGLRDYIQTMTTRRERAEWRIEQIRDAIYSAMIAGEIPKVTFPEGVISVRSVPPSLEVTDESKIPTEFFKPQPPKLDKSRLKEWLESGKTVEGATLSNGGQTLTIRKR